MNKNLKRQDPGLETIGVVQTFSTIATGYLFHCENATVKVELFNAHTIRVNAIRNNKSFEDFSYAITTPPSKTEHQFFESNEQYVIQTEKIKVLISKPLCVFNF